MSVAEFNMWIAYFELQIEERKKQEQLHRMKKQMATKKVNIDIVARDKTTKALSGVQKNLGNLKRSVFSLKGALIGIGAGAIVKSFVDVGREVESLQIRFKFLWSFK